LAAFGLQLKSRKMAWLFISFFNRHKLQGDPVTAKLKVVSSLTGVIKSNVQKQRTSSIYES